MIENCEITILEAIYGFCSNDIEKLTDIKSFVCREFINGGLVKAEDGKLLSIEFDKMMSFLRRHHLINLVFFEDDEPCFEVTKEFSEFLGYTIKGVGI